MPVARAARACGPVKFNAVDRENMKPQRDDYLLRYSRLICSTRCVGKVMQWCCRTWLI
jgi:hypothetical protein